MDSKSPVPANFGIKKWTLVISSLIGIWLYYNWAEEILDMVDSKEFSSQLEQALEQAEEAPQKIRKIKRWTKISFVLLYGAGIMGHLAGAIGGLRSYSFLVNAHLTISLAVVALHGLLFIASIVVSLTNVVSQLSAFENVLMIGCLTFLAGNIAVGWLFRRDIRRIRYREKLSRCTCSSIEAEQGQQQQQQQQQYITAPDGSQYMIYAPQTQIAGFQFNQNSTSGGDNGNGNGGTTSGGTQQWPPPGVWP